MNGAPVLSEQYTRDALGRITSKSETVGGTTTLYGYAYDDSGRLTDGTASSHYTYDENSNRLTRVTPSGTEQATVDAQDRLLTYADATYTYTANGKLATKTDGTGTTAYDCDELGNLLGVTLPTGHRIDYVIDAQNRRVGKKVDGVLVQRFVYGTALRPRGGAGRQRRCRGSIHLCDACQRAGCDHQGRHDRPCNYGSRRQPAGRGEQRYRGDCRVRRVPRVRKAVL